MEGLRRGIKTCPVSSRTGTLPGSRVRSGSILMAPWVRLFSFSGFGGPPNIILKFRVRPRAGPKKKNFNLWGAQKNPPTVFGPKTFCPVLGEHFGELVLSFCLRGKIKAPPVFFMGYLEFFLVF